jgi:hypothetical protein
VTTPKKKEKRSIPLRTSGEAILKPENRPSKVLFDLAVAAEQGEIVASPPTTTNHLLPPPTTRKNLDVSPKRDYTKVANSINRDAIPSGLFKGTSKNTYDVLYQRTRGAIIPSRTLKAVQSDLLVWTNLSHNTLRAHLKHLQIVGLVEIHYKLGDNKGAEYEIFLPEEIDLTAYHLLPPPTTFQNMGGGTTQNMGGGTTQNLLVGGGGLKPADVEENENLKLNSDYKNKTNIDDEESRIVFSDFVEKFQAVAKKLTGAQLSKYEHEKWGRLADLLILELEAAGRRATNPISSIPGFLTKVLISKLLNQKQPERISKSKSGTKTDTVGKYYPELEGSEDEVKSLNTESKEAAVDFLRQFKDDSEFLESYKKWYTEEDWSWIIKEL